MNWERGRQLDGQYAKLKLFQLELGSFFAMDSYLINFKEGDEIPKHVDQVTNKKHYRLNIILKRPTKGGVFRCRETIINTSRIKLFRPDVHAHSVSEVVEGSRLVFSIGVAV